MGRGVFLFERKDSYICTMSQLLSALTTFIRFKTVGRDNETKSLSLDWVWNEFLSTSKTTPVRGEVQGAPYLFIPHPSPVMLWFGHVDVVPAKDEQFTLRVE